MYILYIYIGLKQSNGFRTTNEAERIKSHPSILYHSVKLSLTSYKQMGKRFLSVHQLSREYRAFSIGLSEITRLNDFMSFKMVFSCPWQSLWRKLLLFFCVDWLIKSNLSYERPILSPFRGEIKYINI